MQTRTGLFPTSRWTGRIAVLGGVCSLAITAMLPIGSATARPASASAGERPVYVTNADKTDDISTFTVDAVTGHPTLSDQRVKAGAGVRQMTFTPDARTAYAANSSAGTISVYTVGPRGRLTRRPGTAGTVETGGDTPLGITVTPNGHTLYVAHVFSTSVAAFTIASDGSLTPLTTTTTSVPNPRGVAVTPDGRFLYVGHGDPGEDRPTSVGAISAYAIHSDGSLTALEPPIRVGRFCGSSAITPDGHRLYLTCTDTDEIYGFAIHPDGGLTPLPRSPYTVSDYPEGIAITPDGRFVHIASVGLGTTAEGPGAVSGFAVGRDGALTPVPGSPFATDLFPVGITALPNGRFVFVSGGDATGQLSAFGVDDAGTLHPLPGTPFPTKGKWPAFESASVLPDQGPVAAFTTHPARRSVSLDAAASTDPDGDVARYRWTFGDGTTQTTTDPRTTHSYPRAGTFRTTLVVTDNEGCSTAIIATGQALLCNGTARATTAQDVVVG